jgi:hypothetical protein
MATAKSDAHGNFRVAVQPGTYKIRIKQNALFGSHIRDASLHTGEQSLSAIRTHFDWHEDGHYSTMGELAAKISYSPNYALRHPWRYLKHLTGNG